MVNYNNLASYIPRSFMKYLNNVSRQELIKITTGLPDKDSKFYFLFINLPGVSSGIF